ncbi:MAG: hypothetical protein M1828_007198 [Chrysothrix sp. TS-e1954]|nr:MAG: hypothetical protein M1828_007198 [Chrysothrix sp. TS-e1954]
MSMDAGGLAQMTYNQFNSNNNLGMPGSGFASRGKGAHIKRLSVAPAPTIGSINENEAEVTPTPRTSRSHLLAGLRTAPKTASAMPASAPYNQSHYYAGPNARAGQAMPQTAMASTFNGNNRSGKRYDRNGQQQSYCLPEQILAPPNLDFDDGEDEQMDPQVYDELMATNHYLMQRQQQLQQQLMNVTAAAQQFQGMNLNGYQQYNNGIVSPGTSFYHQQLQNGMQPVIQPVPNQPGIYLVYNPMTGQHSFVSDQQLGLPASPPPTNSGHNSSPEAMSPTGYQRQTSSPPSAAASGWTRPWSPPKQSPSPPQDVTPLPQPSANAYRPGHRKSITSGASRDIGKPSVLEELKSAGLKSAGIPPTPATGTFGLGHGRAGEHPVRQPRGPPPLEELIACPTSNQEGSKNFATRQRRRALFSLVRAGNERRTGRSIGGDVSTPASEAEINFGTSSDVESEVSRSDSLSNSSAEGKPENVANQMLTYAQTSAGGVSDTTPNQESPTERRRTPMFVLTSAEKRKSFMS